MNWQVGFVPDMMWRGTDSGAGGLIDFCRRDDAVIRQLTVLFSARSDKTNPIFSREQNIHHQPKREFVKHQQNRYHTSLIRVFFDSDIFMDERQQTLVEGMAIAALVLAQANFVALVESGLLSKPEAEKFLRQSAASNLQIGSANNKVAAKLLDTVLNNLASMTVENRH